MQQTLIRKKTAIFLTIISINFITYTNHAHAAQIYTYDLENFATNNQTYHDPTINLENNRCLSALIQRLPQQGDKHSTQTCLQTFGYNPEKKITSPVMIIFEISQNSPKMTTIVIYKTQKGQIKQETFAGVGARYSNWYAPPGIYTLDYLIPQTNPSFKPGYGNFYSPRGQKDKHGNAVNLGFHGREGNLMVGKGSNGCHRHRVVDMKRIMTIIHNAGEEANLPSTWYEKTLPIAIIAKAR